MKGWMYILKCSDGSYYTGSTNDLEFRVAEHQNGEGSKYTKKHLPVELVYFEEFGRIDDAFYREMQIKGWSKKKKMVRLCLSAGRITKPDFRLRSGTGR
jgi:putative endonuclease